jgi:2-oxoglutarate dehydrogenase E2 component (dihydrolipoamide succinyltransferase)
VEISAPTDGTLSQVLKQHGQTASIGEIVGYLENGDAAKGPAPAKVSGTGGAKDAELKVEAEAGPTDNQLEAEKKLSEAKGNGAEPEPEPEAEKLQRPKIISSSPPESKEAKPAVVEPEARLSEASPPPAAEDRQEEVVPMNRLRRTIAERLVKAQHTAALLTTFNEIDMGNVMTLRKEHGEAFQKQHHAKLGFMSFYVKATIDALKQFPVLNAEVRENSIVYRNYYDIGIAIGSGKGLVVPLLRNAERLSFAEIEKAIAEFARRAGENKLKPDELQGGTFTITNGGVYGSLLSTPIVNPPQSGVLGMHTIQDRPVAREGAVVIRPMMYVAVTYDHRIVDGREAVGFLKRIKDAIENPARMLIEI